jgi:hypothetical protein
MAVVSDCTNWVNDMPAGCDIGAYNNYFNKVYKHLNSYSPVEQPFGDQISWEM